MPPSIAAKWPAEAFSKEIEFFEQMSLDLQCLDVGH